MAAFFVDLDGTLFHFGTNFFTPGARDFLEWIEENGHQLIFTTRRGDDLEGHPIFDKNKTLEALKRLGIKYNNILFNVVSPRIIVNDDGCEAFQVEKDKGLANLMKSLKDNNYA
jgi:predicted secreted acid phosphatase